MNETMVLNNRYQLEKSLGSGGMAVVYRARDIMLERIVAIKILREDFSSDLEFRERFRQEARAVANLSHPNIVTVHDFGLDQGRLFLVMENVPGTDLKSMLQKRSRFTVEEALPLLIQACAGIGYAHRAGLVHCDIKPQNLLVTPDKRLKVADFGIARALASIQPNERINVVWGSPQYFSPEQAAGSPPSPASDVYSLGVVMYEMLTGQLPFIGSTAAELAQMHREVPPASPRRANPNIPPALEQIMLKVLSKEPSARYRTADQLGRVLINFSNTLNTQSIVGKETPPVFQKPAIPESTKANYQPVQAVKTFPVLPSVEPEVQPVKSVVTDGNPLDIDWSTWGLGLLALIAVGGLIPLWLWVYFLYNPPAH
ncbi:MAG: protein kinase domain-containing protein [Omnitrophica WOR_2 bacterium]